MTFKTCLCEHSADNTTITVRARRGAPAMVFSIEFDAYMTASMVAARKFFAARGVVVEPLNQIREHKLERAGNYVARVRVAA